MIRSAKRSADAGHGSQNYLASVSDLVSALIFVFIIMLAVLAYQLANVTEDLTSAEKTQRQILIDIAIRLQQSGIPVEVIPEQSVLRFVDNAINFSSGSEVPVADHHTHVGRLAQIIAQVVPCFVAIPDPSSDLVKAVPTTDVEERPSYCLPPADPSAYDCPRQENPWLVETLLIEGHTDNVPITGVLRFKDNLELSSIRAATVYRMIAKCEPSIGRLLNSAANPILSTSGYGYTRPATQDIKRMAENRRIDLRFLLEPPLGTLKPVEATVQDEVADQIGERQR